MDQHTFLELVVLGAAIGLSGYIGHAIGHFNGYRKGDTAVRDEQRAWLRGKQILTAVPDTTVYYGNDLYAGQRYTQEQLRPMTKEELRKFNDPYDRS